MFSSIKIIFLEALTSPVRCFRVVISKEDSVLLTITDSVFCFVDLYREDTSVVRNSKR